MMETLPVLDTGCVWLSCDHKTQVLDVYKMEPYEMLFDDEKKSISINTKVSTGRINLNSSEESQRIYSATYGQKGFFRSFDAVKSHIGLDLDGVVSNAQSYTFNLNGKIDLQNMFFTNNAAPFDFLWTTSPFFRTTIYSRSGEQACIIGHIKPKQ